MPSDPAAASESGADSTEVMASVDTSGVTPRLIIADLSAEDRWLSVEEDAATPLAEWR